MSRLYYCTNTVTEFESGGMDIRISSSDGVPIYLQIMTQVKYLIASGRLAPDEELPAIRVLAERLLVNPNTIARAYRELELAGLVTKRRTTGTYVSGAGPRLEHAERIRILTERIDALLAEARQFEVPLPELIELLHERERLLSSEDHPDTQPNGPAKEPSGSGS